MTVSDPLRPNGTSVNQWGYGDHTYVDEAVTQPNAGGGDTWNGYTDDNNEFIAMTFPDTIDDVDEVTNITVWTYGGVYSSHHPEVQIIVGGIGETAQETSLGTIASFKWCSNSFNGSWSQSALDSLVVQYYCDATDKNDGNYLDVVYVIVTYTSTSTGYDHKVLGVASASIGKVLGVATASIGKVNGK